MEQGVASAAWRTRDRSFVVKRPIVARYDGRFAAIPEANCCGELLCVGLQKLRFKCA